MMQRVALFAASLLVLAILPSAQEMDPSSCPSPQPDSSKSLMQRRKDSPVKAQWLLGWIEVLFCHSPSDSCLQRFCVHFCVKSKENCCFPRVVPWKELLTHLHPRHKHAKVQNGTREPSSQVANLLAQEMEELAASKGQMGLSPEEIEHINSIKDMIVGSILPSITDGVEETRAEVKVLFDAVTSCVNHATDALADIAQLESDTESNSNSHGTCRKKEDDIIEDKNRVCGELEQAKKGVHKPELDFEVTMDISDEDMVRYLRSMEDHFCGRWSEFKETWEECEDLTDNYTKTHENCVDLQQDLEESWCTWKMELEETCEEFDSCWSAAVERYNERKEAIEALQEARLNEYEGALKVNCYWDAWKWDAEP
eukprot:532893-Amphidinium_carterae.1